MSAFREHLDTHHFVPVPIDLPYGELEEAAALFLEFLTEVPDEAKRTIHFKSPYERGSADGYSDKRDIAGKDSKEFVHFCPRLFAYPEFTKLKDDYKAAEKFFEAAGRIYQRMDALASALFLKEFPDLADHVVEDGKLKNAVVRFLCYAPRRSTTFNAKPHYDKSYGTLALAESTPGLRIGCCDLHPLAEVVHTREAALFMPGELMFEDSERTIIPAWHDVLTGNDTKAVNDRCERWAIVFFIDDKEGRYPSWEKAHTPLRVHTTS